MKYRRSVSLCVGKRPAVLNFDRFLRLQSSSINANQYVEFSETRPEVLGIPAAALPSYREPATVSWRGRWYTLQTKRLPEETGGYRVLICPKTREEELRRKVAIYEKILNTIHEGVLVTDPGGRVIFYNQELAVLEGIDPREAIGKHVTELYRQSPGDSEHLQVSQTSRPIPESFQKYFTQNGVEVHSVASTVPIIENGELLAVYSVCRETTHMKEMLIRTMQLQGMDSEAEENPKTDGRKVPKSATYNFAHIVGKSKPMQEVVRAAQRAMLTSANILIYGETGTGKELLVQSIHNGSPWRAQPFVAINCAAIPENLLETMLFGAVKGAYTGAVPTVGLCEYAADGTLYLDEISSMSIGLQAKLLRAVQERSFRKVGSVTESPLRCRIISSINVDPLTCLQKHLLREDLFYRLSVISLYLPPLRERTGDIPLLIEYFIKKHSPRNDLKKMDPDLARLLLHYRWSGNIRELENTVESMIYLTGEEKWLTYEHLPAYLKAQVGKTTPLPAASEGGSGPRLNSSLLSAENNIIVEALKKHRGNINREDRKSVV